MKNIKPTAYHNFLVRWAEEKPQDGIYVRTYKLKNIPLSTDMEGKIVEISALKILAVLWFE